MLSGKTRADRSLYLWPAIYLVEVTQTIIPDGTMPIWVDC